MLSSQSVYYFRSLHWPPSFHLLLPYAFLASGLFQPPMSMAIRSAISCRLAIPYLHKLFRPSRYFQVELGHACSTMATSPRDCHCRGCIPNGIPALERVSELRHAKKLPTSNVGRSCLEELLIGKCSETLCCSVDQITLLCLP